MPPLDLIGPVLAVSVAAGCGFQAGAAPIDATDATLDAATIIAPASCNELHTTSPALPSGSYVIDPDGSGGDPALSVTCDMVAEGGGWTIVFFPSTPNVMTTPMTYTSSTPRLLADAQTVLLAFRDATEVAVTDHATFDLPDPWRTSTPFTYPNNDLTVNVSIDGGATAPAMVRYGSGNFGNKCTDPWMPGAPFGRVCIATTLAPFYTGFADPSPDYCNPGPADYNAVGCTNDTRFSIAVR